MQASDSALGGNGAKGIQPAKSVEDGDIFYRQNDVEQAMKLWEAATKERPETAVQAYLNLAWLSENQGDFEQAIALLKKPVNWQIKTNRPTRISCI